MEIVYFRDSFEEILRFKEKRKNEHQHALAFSWLECLGVDTDGGRQGKAIKIADTVTAESR